MDFQQCGKLIVAGTPDQLLELAAIKVQGERNGVNDLRIIGAAEARALEPELSCAGALLSPSSGIIDSHQLMLACQGEAEANGCVVLPRVLVSYGRISNGRIVLGAGSNEQLEIEARLVINSAGLSAQSVARSIEGFNSACVPPLHLAKGNYFSLSGKAPFAKLVYPMPEPGGLGIHFTLDLSGVGRFGPDVEWIDSLDYDVDPALAPIFRDSIMRYWPGLAIDRLHPAYAGIRPKIARPGGSGTDFIIQGPAVHGYPGLINLFGIESPGLTASLAIANLVAAMARAEGDAFRRQV